MQVVPVQDTPSSSEYGLPAGFCGRIEAHFDPFHWRATVETVSPEPDEPTATQEDDPEQDTAFSRSGDSGLGVVWSAHDFPLKAAAIVASLPLFVE
jgi:hypothetical protein